MDPTNSSGGRLLWWAYMIVLTLIQLVASFVFSWIVAYSGSHYEFDPFAIALPVFFMSTCLHKFWLDYKMIYGGQANQMRNVIVGIIYRIWIFLGNLLNISKNHNQKFNLLL